MGLRGFYSWYLQFLYLLNVVVHGYGDREIFSGISQIRDNCLTVSRAGWQGDSVCRPADKTKGGYVVF